MDIIDATVVRDWIKSADVTNPGVRKGLVRALGYVYANQTADEKATGTTRVLNGMGFNGRDAEFLTSIYQNSQKYGNVTIGQAKCLVKVLPKYARQIAEGSASGRKYVSVTT